MAVGHRRLRAKRLHAGGLKLAVILFRTLLGPVFNDADTLWRV